MDVEEKNIVKLIKAHGYKMTNDKMGIYFDYNNKKFSIIKTGEIYNCYCNEKSKEDSKYELQDTYYSQILLKQCLYWILNKINNK